MPDVTLGDGCPSQRYDDAQVDRIVREALPRFATLEVGKVYCPFCKFREARWRRHFDAADSNLVHVFVYCTQCHRTGIKDVDLETARAQRGPWSWLRAWFRRKSR
jgi:hypothetical protein